jgi:hypothetical protein
MPFPSTVFVVVHPSDGLLHGYTDKLGFRNPIIFGYHSKSKARKAIKKGKFLGGVARKTTENDLRAAARQMVQDGATNVLLCLNPVNGRFTGGSLCLASAWDHGS